MDQNPEGNSTPRASSHPDVVTISSLAHITPEGSTNILRDYGQSYGETRLLSIKNFSRDGLDDTPKLNQAAKDSIHSIDSLQLLVDRNVSDLKTANSDYQSNKFKSKVIRPNTQTKTPISKTGISSLQHIDELPNEDSVRVSKKGVLPFKNTISTDKNMRYLDLREEYSPSMKLMEYSARSPGVVGFIEEKHSEEFDGNYCIDFESSHLSNFEKSGKLLQKGLGGNRKPFMDGLSSHNHPLQFGRRHQETTGLNIKHDQEANPEEIMVHRMLNSPHREFQEAERDNDLPSNLPSVDRAFMRNFQEIEVLPGVVNNNTNPQGPTNALIPSEHQGQTGMVGVIPEESAQVVNTNIETALKTETKLYLIRCMIFFASISVISLYLFLMAIDQVKPQGLLLVVSGCIIFMIIENFFRIRHPNRESWKVKEDRFYTLDYISVAICLVCIHSRTTQILYVICSCIPFLFSAVAYSFSSQAPKGIGAARAVVRCLYGAQALMLMVQINGIVNWDWKFILFFSWIYLGLCAPYLVAFGLMVILMLLFAFFRQRLYGNIRVKTEILGLFWFFLYYGLSAVGCMVLMGIANAYNATRDFSLLREATIICVTINFILFFYTGIAFESLTDFVQTFNTTNNSSRDLEYNEASMASQAGINLEVEKKESYFIMLSSTYFQPLKNGFAGNNIQRVEEIRKTLSNFRIWRIGSHYLRRNPLEAKKAPVNVKTLQQYKQTLDEKFAKTKIKKKSFSSKDLRGKRSQRLQFPEDPNQKVVESEREFETGEMAGKVCHSEGDKENMKKFNASAKMQQPAQVEDNMCYICYNASANALLMNCGHGGICYECAVAMVKKKNECMECRGEVEMIVKVDPNPKMSDIIKGVEFSKVSRNVISQIIA